MGRRAPAQEPDFGQEFRSELRRVLIWPVVPFLLVVTASFGGMGVQGVRTHQRLLERGATAEARVLRVEEVRSRKGRMVPHFVYEYRDRDGKAHGGRFGAKDAEKRGIGIGSRFPITYDTAAPDSHVRYRVTREQLYKPLTTVAGFCAILWAALLLLACGGAAVNARQRVKRRKAE